MSEAEGTDTAEMQFSVLRRGNKDPQGPYTEKDLLNLLNNNELGIEDLVYYDGQDTLKVGIAFREVSNVVGNGEDIYYIAVQEKVGLLSKTKQCVIITDRHIFILHEKRVGYELEAHPWKNVTNTLMRDEGKGLGTFSILLGVDHRVDVAHIPLKQVQRLFQLSQEMKEGSKD